jgi:uncharacterized cupin superfamily protein
MEGDVVCFPRGKEGAHQIMNRIDSRSASCCCRRWLAPMSSITIDSGKVYATDLAGEPIMFSRPGPTVAYWEGED